jgi:hypothetical protein
MRGMVVLLTLAAVGTLYAHTGVASSCPAPSAPADFPDPATATEPDIVAAQQSVKQYLTVVEAQLKCLDNAHDSLGHDKAVDEMQKTAVKFNTLLKAYRARPKT